MIRRTNGNEKHHGNNDLKLTEQKLDRLKPIQGGTAS